MSNNLRELGRKKFTSISREIIKSKDEGEDMVNMRDKDYYNNYNALTKCLKNMYRRDVRKVEIMPINQNVPVPSFLDAGSSVDALHNYCEGLKFPIQKYFS